MRPLSSEKRDRSADAPPYTVLRPVSRTEHVRDQIEAAIAHGTYAPGDKLPSERELGALTGVSRVSVREAIRSLEAVGLVEVRHGSGCFVAATRGDQYASSFGHWLFVHRDEMFELLKVRGALDELAAEAAADRTPGDVAHLRALNDAFRAVAEDDVAALVARDVEFHDAVAELSGSRLLTTLLRELHETFNESRQATLRPAGRQAESAGEHDAIIEAIERGDPPAARAAVARHLASVRAALARLLETTPTRSETNERTSRERAPEGVDDAGSADRRSAVRARPGADVRELRPRDGRGRRPRPGLGAG